MSELVDLLTRLAKEKGFGNETFRPIYLIYRVLARARWLLEAP